MLIYERRILWASLWSFVLGIAVSLMVSASSAPSNPQGCAGGLYAPALAGQHKESEAMAVKLSTERKFRAPVPMAWFDESGQQQQDAFTACFRVMSSDELDKPENAEKRLLDIVLVSVEDLELVDAAGQVLEGEALLEAAKCDPVIAGALIVAYRESNAKKPKQRISGKRS